MVRTLPEWIGATDNAEIPPRVRLRVCDRFHGCCAKCGRLLVRGRWALDHVIALANGGEHCESNMQPLCAVPCHSDKTRADVASKSASYSRRLSHAGIKRKRPSFATNKDAPFKRRMDGTVVRR